MVTFSRQQHEKRRLIFCVLGYVLGITVFYSMKWSYEASAHAIGENYIFADGAQFPYLYVLGIAVLTYLVSFVDLLFKDFD